MTNDEFHQVLEKRRAAAIIRHEIDRQRARRRGRKDFPMLPFECSWAFEMQLRKELQRPQPQRGPRPKPLY